MRKWLKNGPMELYTETGSKPHADSLDLQQWGPWSAIGKGWLCTINDARSVNSPYGKKCIES